MDQAKAKDVLVEAFSVLTDEQAANYEYHLARKTRVLCGTNWVLYTDGNGGG